MSDQPPESMDAALDAWVERFRHTKRCDNAAEEFRALLRRRIEGAGLDGREARLLELNLLGSVSAWMEFSISERAAGHNVVPDFARHLSNAFLAHCRAQRIDPEVAVGMAVELATAIMSTACGFRRHLNLADPGEARAPQG
jgi:hypothetical protein